LKRKIVCYKFAEDNTCPGHFAPAANIASGVPGNSARTGSPRLGLFCFSVFDLQWTRAATHHGGEALAEES
jgi:hypothetical protein